jgi:hypothetical protein
MVVLEEEVPLLHFVQEVEAAVTKELVVLQQPAVLEVLVEQVEPILVHG